ncbi:class II glutamine amidotransferase [Engelhardtia mirabilis]|uniref:Glutamine amidotransferase type-2 domain-containing protein n=1 Tax=Engelhardtia mirabilis TaxID=2528011 RepID=A0A518BHA1_9BACT|nr:hypothetical protein Pla133_14160 [Planctomycetes bacterium Pla133]QDV00672.1 hypothetical protein Pla86_14150 [Planctomycetes bacterium Pla86]
MCELFALSSRQPTRVSLSFEAFAEHGDPGGENRDGWGIAYYPGRSSRLMKEPAPAGDSELVRFIEVHDYASGLVVSHIRHASQGHISFDNTHPFERELGGTSHVFCHNGDLGQEIGRLAKGLGRFRPIGQTDSELAFCYLLSALEPMWLGAVGVPPLLERTAAVRECASLFAELGQANFLYADGDALFVHAHWREPADGSEGRGPGLHVLTHPLETAPHPVDVPGIRIRHAARNGPVAAVASVPLTSAPWEPIEQGTLLVVRDGVVVDRART